jgi:uncharacterized SAM-binding protein YcdF (DUF218 family)
MKTYDLIVVLGYGFVGGWHLSEHVHNRLKIVADIYGQGRARKIAVCGKWSLAWEQRNILPPTTEAEAMKKLLIQLGVEEQDIIKEDFSKDTVGNAYYLKTKIVKKLGIRQILVACADYAQARVKYIFYKVFEPRYSITYMPTPTPYKDDKDILDAQHTVLLLQKRFLRRMKRGDEKFLKNRLYNDPYYQQKVPEKVTHVALGGKKWLSRNSRGNGSKLALSSC